MVFVIFYSNIIYYSQNPVDLSFNIKVQLEGALIGYLEPN